MSALFPTIKSTVDPLQVGELAEGFWPVYQTGTNVDTKLLPWGTALFDGYTPDNGLVNAVRLPKAADTTEMFRGFLFIRKDYVTDGIPPPAISPVDATVGNVAFDYISEGAIKVVAGVALTHTDKIGVSLVASTLGQIVASPTPAVETIVDLDSLGWKYQGVDVAKDAVITIRKV